MLEIGSLVDGKYKILSEIGHGGMSVVYMAINEKANKTWAIKEVRKEGVNDFKAVKQGLIVETEMLKKLNHQFLPSIIDVIDMEDSFIIVMDYIEGNSLNQRLKEYGAQPQENVIRWAKELCDVLGYLHSRQPAIIYRDMKPANVMLKPDGHITLIDFGTAKEFKEFNVKDTISFGTIGYAAPEQFGGKTDARTDVYCLGATLYHLVTGMDPSAPPYEIRPIRQINPALSSGLEKIIIKCTQREPEKRYQSCAELMYALEHYNEIDDMHLKKQKRKIFGFGMSVVATIAAGITAVFANSGAKGVLSENYDYLISQAGDATLTQAEKTELYYEAIQTDPTRTDAYLKMVEMYLSDATGFEDGTDSETGAFTREESSYITQLKSGLDSANDKGFSSTSKPFEALKEGNPEGYAQVCYEIGMAYWYYFEVESARETSAKDWFEEATSYNETAEIYVAIGQSKQNIEKYRTQNRLEEQEHEYRVVWDNMQRLIDNISNVNDTIKRLIWREVVEMIIDEVAYFGEVSQEEMEELLLDIQEDAEIMRNTTKYPNVQEEADKILNLIKEAKNRIEVTK